MYFLTALTNLMHVKFNTISLIKKEWRQTFILFQFFVLHLSFATFKTVVKTTASLFWFFFFLFYFTVACTINYSIETFLKFTTKIFPVLTETCHIYRKTIIYGNNMLCLVFVLINLLMIVWNLFCQKGGKKKYVIKITVARMLLITYNGCGWFAVSQFS